MNLYLAAVYTNNYMPGQNQYPRFNETERAIVHNLPFILESYHYVKSQKFVDQIRANEGKVFIDSGAFSANNLGVEINIDDYCNYIKRNKDIILVEDGVVMASVLDGIGDPLKTWQNQLYMEHFGAKPLPCFHFGEDTRYLEWYVERYPYITLGGMVSSKTNSLIQWLDRIWEEHLLDGSGRPKLKVHAFGVTTIKLMERYPWHSVDSSTWIQNASFGSISTVNRGPLAVSNKSPSRHDIGRHVSTLSQIERAQVESELAADGFAYDRLSTEYVSRAAYNLLGYTRIGHRINQHYEDCNGVLDCHKVQQLF